jgi:hypothetical protein
MVDSHLPLELAEIKAVDRNIFVYPLQVCLKIVWAGPIFVFAFAFAEGAPVDAVGLGPNLVDTFFVSIEVVAGTEPLRP